MRAGTECVLVVEPVDQVARDAVLVDRPVVEPGEGGGQGLVRPRRRGPHLCNASTTCCRKPVSFSSATHFDGQEPNARIGIGQRRYEELA